MAWGHSAFYVVSAACIQRISALLPWFLLLTQVGAQGRSREVDILLNYKAQMQQVFEISIAGPIGGQVSNSKGYWSTWNNMDDNPCGWEGITCNDANSTVELDFSAWGLQYLVGTWELLSGLPDLRKLDFSSNNFGASLNAMIPPDIQTLTALTHLDLSSSGFGGTIPPNISACLNLQYISLENNYLAGEIPSLGGLVNLELLLLGSNALSGGFPLGLGTSLVGIDLSNNLLNGTIPVLSNLTNLLHLKLDSNNFTEFEGPLFPGAKNLEVLSISGNQLTGSIPSGITNLANLKILNISHNQLSGDIPSDFYIGQSNSSLLSSFSLDLSDNQLTGTISTNILQLADYMSMNLSNNLLTGDVSIDEGWAYSYDVLDLSNNNLSGQIPPFFINDRTWINSLCLQNNQFSGDIMDFLLCTDRDTTVWTAELRMGNNFFTGDLSRIVKSNETGNATIGPPKWLNLQVLDLSNNYLRISTTEATDPLSAVLEFFMGGMPLLGCHLMEFYLGGNNFTGIPPPAHFPEDSYNFSWTLCLEVLDLSNSHLEGEISGAVFNSMWLPSLQFLNLSNNDVIGPIVDSIVMMPNLEVLDLSNNKLSGKLPYIPPTSRLYNPTFYANNSGLCGEPLSPCVHGEGLKWWVWLIAAGSIIIALGSCLATSWRWRVYQERHQQDADLIQTLLEGEPTALMSLRELRRATDSFSQSAQIGEGGFGIVYKGRLKDGTLVAIKKSKHLQRALKDKQLFLNEVRILSQLNHRHLVKLLGCCMENQIALLVFEFISNGTLEEHLEGKFGGVCLNWNQRLNIAIQVANALHYLHSLVEFPIYHRDVKSANILLDSDLNAKVADFGISRLAPLRATHISTISILGTIGYIDPEYYRSFKYTDKSDVYSFGVVLLELISAKPTMDSSRDEDEASLVGFALPHIQSGDLHQLLDPTLMETYNTPTGQGRESILNVGRLALKCLDMPAKARPSMNEVWKELQILRLELSRTSEHFENIDENLSHDHIVLDCEALSGKSSENSRDIHNDSVIPKSQFCHRRRVRSRSC